MSTKDAWYFDHGFWGQTRYYTWKMAYKNRIPRDRNVLGGEACVWSELIDRNSIGNRIHNRINTSNFHYSENFLKTSSESFALVYTCQKF